LCLLLATNLGACAPLAASSPTQDHRLLVIASIFAPFDFARQIAGSNADVRMLVPPGAETHSFEPKPQDIIALQSCDLFIYVGGESDAWLEDILATIDTSHMTIIRLLDCVEVLAEEQVEGMQASAFFTEGEGHAHAADADAHDEPGHADAEPDEHVWTSVANAKRIVRALADALKAADPGNGARYEQNTAAYLQQLDQLDDLFTEVVAQAQRTTIVFGDRFPFRYLAAEYGLTYSAAFSGCSTATEPNAQTVAFLVNKIADEQLPVVFFIELSSHRIADVLAEETGAKPLLLHACHNISKDDFAAGATYVSLMRQNAANLREALS
jgi:zinc transport system substrate-binding protein